MATQKDIKEIFTEAYNQGIITQFTIFFTVDYFQQYSQA